jgi:predicted ATPase
VFAQNGYSADDRCGPIPLRPAPEIFFGREKLTANREQTRLTLLGAGGMGEKSVALQILNHELVVNHYDNRRYFVYCDAITSAETLAELILHFLGIPPVYGENILETMHRTVSAVHNASPG